MQITNELVATVRKAVARKVADLFDRDDVVQMVLIALWESAEELTVPSTLFFKKLEFYRTQKTPSLVVQKDGVKKRVIFGFDSIDELHIFSTTNPEKLLTIKEREDAVQKAVGTLKRTMLASAMLQLEEGSIPGGEAYASLRSSWVGAKKKLKEQLKMFDFTIEDSYIGSYERA